MKKVIVVGCGFAGLSAVQVLAQYVGLKITLIDQKNHHLFQPLLYQVATGELDSGHIASPIRSIMSKYEDVTVVKSKVTNVDLKSKIVTAVCGEFKYDYLVMACGALHSYFGKENWETYAPGLKTIEQALEIKNRIFNSFEEAEKEPNLKKREKLLSFAIVGGGPTGVEMAGAIADITHLILTRNFRNIDPASAKITLIDAEPRILSAFSEKYSNKAKIYLENMGVNVLVGQRVTNIDETGVTIGNKKFKASTVIWGAGVAATEITKTLGVELDRAGRAIVERDLSLKKYSKVFVIGDQAHALDSKGNLYPGVATVALQQGKCTGRNILRDIEGKKRKKFVYFNRGKAATIGKSKAVLECWKFKASGLTAWIMWLGIHIWFLKGLENRIFVLIQWSWFYLFSKSNARIILNKEWKSYPKK